MKLRFFLFIFLTNITFISQVTIAEPIKILGLSQSIQENLIKATPILGKKITKEIFNEKPILITFFASW